MNYKTYITRLKHTLLKKKPVVRDPQLMHPEREWAIGLFVAALIFSVCGLWSIYAYLNNRSASALPVEDTSGQTVYRESVVKEALEIVAQRKETFEALTSESHTPQAIPEEIATTTPPTVETVVPIEEPAPDTEVPTLGN